MSADLAKLIVSLELQSASYMKGFDQATARLNKFSKDSHDQLKSVADIFAGVLSADAILEFSKSTLEASANLADFSKSAGISVEALSALQFAAKAGGVSTEELNTSLKKLNVSISDAAGNASGKAGLAFQLLGVNVKNANGSLKDANQVFNEIADKFAATADGANKVSLAVALFGKAGETLIPTLDKGSAGLKELADAAAAAGAIIDGPTAEAAKAFTEKMELLKVTLVDGLGAQVEKSLLPTLNALADEFLANTKNSTELRDITDEVTAGFKLLISVGVGVKDTFETAGRAIGASFASVRTLLTGGSIKDVISSYDDVIGELVNGAKKTVSDVAKVWTDGSKDILAPIEVTAQKIKETLGSLSGAEAAVAALKELEAFANQLGQEAQKLEAGKIAATNYALEHGRLAEALKLTGEKGQEAADKIRGFARDIDLEKTTKSVKELAAQLAAIGGDTAGGALEHFDASTKDLQETLKKLGGDAQASGQAVIDNLRQATVYQQAFNVLQTNAARINQDAAIAEAKVNAAEAAGQITSLEAERQLQAIRLQTISQLQGIKNGEDSVAAAANQPALTQGAKQFGASIDALKAKTDELTTSVRNGLESAFANNFSDLITGAKSFGDAITGLLKDVEKQFADLIAKQFAQQLFGAATGGSGGGALGGIAPFLSGLFGGGAHADGGVIPSGQIGLVGERGPELVMGAAGGTNVIPNGQTGGGPTMHVVQHFTIQAPGGQISRPAQQQTAAAAARGLASAARRNN